MSLAGKFMQHYTEKLRDSSKCVWKYGVGSEGAP